MDLLGLGEHELGGLEIRVGSGWIWVGGLGLVDLGLGREDSERRGLCGLRLSALWLRGVEVGGLGRALGVGTRELGMCGL